MIKKLTIKNFKSIKDLTLDCRRVNLFIGEPNTGKSNILEALALFSLPYSGDIHSLVRKSDLSNLFFENDVSNIIVVEADDLYYEFQFKQEMVYILFGSRGKTDWEFQMGMTQNEILSPIPQKDYGIHPYFFKGHRKFNPRYFNEFLFPPHGDNLFSVLQKNRNLRRVAGMIIEDRGFKLALRQQTREIEITRESEGIISTFPYSVISDTLQRLIFYLAAIETNAEGTTLVFEEPESNVFPYYTKVLSEKIALDDTRQYFISTHNPYFLHSIIEKTIVEDLQINIVCMDHYSFTTLIRQITDRNSMEKILNLGEDIFLNLDTFIE